MEAAQRALEQAEAKAAEEALVASQAKETEAPDANAGPEIQEADTGVADTPSPATTLKNAKSLTKTQPKTRKKKAKKAEVLPPSQLRSSNKLFFENNNKKIRKAPKKRPASRNLSRQVLKHDICFCQMRAS